jgi:hypothetical protein
MDLKTHRLLAKIESNVGFDERGPRVYLSPEECRGLMDHIRMLSAPRVGAPYRTPAPGLPLE